MAIELPIRHPGSAGSRKGVKLPGVADVKPAPSVRDPGVKVPKAVPSGLEDAVTHHVEPRGVVSVGADDDLHTVALCRRAVQVV